jgi:hypothetical protein
MNAAADKPQSKLGTLVIYDVKGQCGTCKHVYVEHKMAACGFERREFGHAQNCPCYRRSGE